MKKMTAVLAATLALSGCIPTQWTKPGATAGDFERDKQQCIYEADLHTQDANANPFASLQLVPECLRARGWVPAGANP